MTVNDPRPALAATLAAGLAPAAEALAAACAEDASPEPPPPILSDYDGSDECHWGDRAHVGKLDTPEYRAWEERHRHRDEREEREEEAEALAARARGGGDGGREEHDIS